MASILRRPKRSRCLAWTDIHTFSRGSLIPPPTRLSGIVVALRFLLCLRPTCLFQIQLDSLRSRGALIQACQYVVGYNDRPVAYYCKDDCVTGGHVDSHFRAHLLDVKLANVSRLLFRRRVVHYDVKQVTAENICHGRHREVRYGLLGWLPL